MALQKPALTERLQTLNSLIFETFRGPKLKRGRIVSTGILGYEQVLHVLASLGAPVDAYDTTAARVPSVLGGGLDAFRFSKCPDNVTLHFDETDPVEGVAVLLLLKDVPPPCVSFLPSAIVAGEESLLREALKDHEFFPRVLWNDTLAVELAN